jgi:hypothetical protein
VPNEPLNTQPLQSFINQVKAADLSRQKEIRIDLQVAKNLSYTLGVLLARLAGDYEDLLKKVAQKEEIVNVTMDGGDWTNQENR